MEKQNRRSSGKLGACGIVWRVAVIGACLLMLCIHLLGGLYAKYASNNSGGDSARVAKFDVEVTGDADVAISTMELTDNVYAITILNNSEVDVEYKLNAVISSPHVSGVFDPACGYLNPGEDTTVNLTFSVTNWSGITQGMTGATDSIPIDFFVTVSVVQVD